MKKIICLVITLLMTLPVYAKLTAHEEARINAMLEGLAQKKDLIFVRNGDEHTCYGSGFSSASEARQYP